jgi:hypothetical protein
VLIAIALIVLALLLCCGVAALWFFGHARRTEDAPDPPVPGAPPDPNMDDRTIPIAAPAPDVDATRPGPVPRTVAKLMFADGRVAPLHASSDVVLGRLGDVVVADPMAGRRHARITRHGETYMLDDLQSLNGTFINGQRLTSTHRLIRGDRIQVGASVLTFVEEGDPIIPDLKSAPTRKENTL